MTLAEREAVKPLARRNLGSNVYFDPSIYNNEESFDDESGNYMGGKYIRIVQKTSGAFDDDPSWLGKFYYNNTDEDAEPFDNPLEEITIVPLNGAAKRQKWVGDGRNSEVVCVAMGPKFSTLKGEGLPGGECGKCPEAKWYKNEDGKRVTNCDKVYHFVVYVVEWEDVCLLEISRVQSPVGRAILDWVKIQGGGETKDGYTNTVIKLRSVYVNRAQYDNTSGNTCVVEPEYIVQLGGGEDTEEKNARRRRRRQQSEDENTWFTPEAYWMAGSLEDNEIFMNIQVDDEESDDDQPAEYATNDDDDLPF